MLVSPLLGAQGIDYKPVNVPDAPQDRAARSDAHTNAKHSGNEKEARLLAALARAPISFEDRRVTPVAGVE